MPNTILLKGLHAGNYEEGRAAAAITPGMLIALDGDNNLIPHGTAGGHAEANFAIEDALIGKTITDAYASGDLVRYVKAQKGYEIYAILKDGENANEGSGLSSNGDGKFQVVAGSEQVIAYAREALNLTSAGADGRIKIRVK